MNPHTGEIALADSLTADERKAFTHPVYASNLTTRQRSELTATGRTRTFKNSPCPCGSRKRFKNCCRKTA